jgi:hypothetical protein
MSKEVESEMIGFMEKFVEIQKIVETKMFMINVFVPTLRQIFEEANPEKWKEWKGACCKQTAIFSACFLSGIFPQSNFTVWEGMFVDNPENGDKVLYNHAWVYGRTPHHQLYIDLGRTEKPMLFEFVKSNFHPREHYGYKDMREAERTQIDWRKLYSEEIEYFTGKPSTEVMYDLNIRILKNLQKESENNGVQK